MAIGLLGLLGYVYLSDDTEPEMASAIAMTAQLSDVSGSSTTGMVLLELNTRDGEVCYHVTDAPVVSPYSLALVSGVAAAGGGDGVIVDLGAHESGSIGCARGDAARNQDAFASPAAHFVELRAADGVIMRGTLTYTPDGGGIAALGGTDGEVAAPAAGDEAAGRDPNKAGFILPDTASSSRWEDFDRPLISAACQEAGIECLIENAQGDAANMAAIADEMIAQGISVLAIANLDSESGAAIQQKAAAAGVHNVDYDRLTINGAAEVYVSFDNDGVGRAMGEGLMQCLGDTEGARIIQLHGSPTDNNATLFREGYQAAIADSGIETVGDEAVPDWDGPQAREIFARQFADAGGSIDGVIAANDVLSLSAQSVLAEAGLTVPTTGQDATVEGLRAILQGTQCMTVYKPVKVEADAVVAATVALLREVDPPANATINNGVAEIPFVQGQIASIFYDDVRIPIQDGFVAKDDVCSGLEQLCREAGIE